MADLDKILKSISKYPANDVREALRKLEESRDRGDQKEGVGSKFTENQLSQMSRFLPANMYPDILPELNLTPVHHIEPPENWREIFEHYPLGYQSYSNSVTSVDDDGCTVIKMDTKWKIAEYERNDIVTKTVYTIENTGGGSASLTLGAAATIVGSGGGGTLGVGGPVRLYVVVKYEIGPKWYYHFIVTAKTTLTYCPPNMIPQLENEIISGELKPVGHAAEALISTTILTGGLEDWSHAKKIRDGHLRRHPDSASSHDALGLRDS